MQRIIAPSLLSSDFSNLAREANHVLECGADWLHMDVMDGHFVPNLTIGAPVIKSLRATTKGFLDCHLMVSDPEKWVEDFAKAGADQYTFHIEATDHPKKLAEKIRSLGMKVGIAIKPETNIDELVRLIDKGLVDTALVMTVEPGFGGQKFIQDMMPKVAALRVMFPNLNIQVDGGINEETVQCAINSGANVIVAGSFIFKASDKKEAINKLRV